MAKETRKRPRDDDEEETKPRKRPRAEEDDEDDEEDEAPRKKKGSGKKGSGSGALTTVIPYKNKAALSAYYCGVFGLIMGLGFILGPIAAMLGILGLAKARMMPEAKGTGHAIAGIILGIVDVILWPILWVFVLRDMAIPPK